MCVCVCARDHLLSSIELLRASRYFVPFVPLNPFQIFLSFEQIETLETLGVVCVNFAKVEISRDC